MNNRLIVILLIFFSTLTVFSQGHDSLYHKTANIFKPSVVSTHPSGIFLSRIQGNFNFAPTESTKINLSVESGNVWSPPVVAYIPNQTSDRDFISQFPWHVREFAVDVDTLDAKSLKVASDGVIKGFRPNIRFKLNTTSELKIGMRLFLLSGGKAPFSLVTNDNFIEYFHDNIAGGDDPFDRGLYPKNKASLLFKDRNDNQVNIKRGDVFLNGFEFTHLFYPEFLKNEERHLYFNIATHVGLNTSQYNSSIDFGIGINAMKQYAYKQVGLFNIGFNLGINRLNLFDLKSSNVEFASNDYLANIETIIEYNFFSKGKTRHAFGLDFYIQTSLYKTDEFDYLIPTKNGTSFKSWNMGTENLYKNNNYWTLMYTFQKKGSMTFYLQQDLTVNNNPDIQAGINIIFEL
ncbi:hypothetical protein [uncultured Psychroserpens sp.]|uniref:hypothetical protein n=1 Tax=uncultured Psychroserpens sp. TaxID=255436 RepID=UPI00260A77E2|nr:hypothetical protein [uncultured Psychroserpens sp.]